ncbi:MFS transporter [Egicoccus sp. AB-alg6-2]|uniref:MFS transporter n=1 Tax=Egicoccus sp. AB-alg6-2 TaxID=3242692 RepID=UPI00359EE28D
MAGRARRPLVVLFLASMVFTIGDGSIQILIAPHLQGQGITTTRIGPIVAAYSVGALFFRFVTGAVYRADRIRYLVPGGCLLQSLSFVVLANSSSAGVLAAATATNGIGFAIASTGGLAAVMELRPASDAGVLMGWYTGCIGAGYAISSFLGGFAGDTLGIPRAISVLAVLPVVAAAGLAAAAWHITDDVHDTPPAAAAPRRPRGVRALGRLSPFVLLAFFCALHINLLSGVLHAYFPLYGLAIGLSLTQVGSLSGTSSAVSSALRFATPALFRRVPYRRLLPWMVLLGGLATAALTISRLFAVLAAAWIGIGASRAILRVASAALVMDASAGAQRRRGAASGVYMSGLDIGKIVGPVLGGFSVDAFGYEATFLLAGLGIPIVFFAYYGWLKARGTPATA